jgi:hypothetical protein
MRFQYERTKVRLFLLFTLQDEPMRRFWPAIVLSFACGFAVCWLVRDSRDQRAHQTPAQTPPQSIVMWRSPTPGAPQVEHRLKLVGYNDGRTYTRLHPAPDDTSKMWTVIDAESGVTANYEHITP